MKEENNGKINEADSKGLHSNFQENDQSKIKVIEEEFAHFIQYNTRFYLKEFKKFKFDGVYRFRITWNWPAFLFSWVWMAARKMYLLALLTFLLIWFFSINFHPTVHLLNFTVSMFINPNPPAFSDLYPAISLMIICGATGNYLYYRKVKKRVLELKNSKKFSSLREKLFALENDGGLNRWIVVVAAPLLLLFLVYPWILLIQ